MNKFFLISIALVCGILFVIFVANLLGTGEVFSNYF